MKEYILGVRQGTFVPDGQQEPVDYCNVHILEGLDPNADPRNSRGRFPTKLQLNPDSFLKFDKPGDYEVSYNRRGKMPVLTIIK